MFCLKINLKSNPTPEKLFSEFGKLKRLCFNRFVDGLSFQDALLWFKDNVEYELDRSFLGWAMLDAKGMYDSHVALKTKTPVRFSVPTAISNFTGKKKIYRTARKKDCTQSPKLKRKLRGALPHCPATFLAALMAYDMASLLCAR